MRPARAKEKPPDQPDPGARSHFGSGFQFGVRVAKVAALPTAVAELEMKGV